MIRNSSLTAQQKLLLFVLADYAGDNGSAFPSQETLATDVSLSIRQVRRLLLALSKTGILATEPRGKRNHYRIRWESIADTSVRSHGPTPVTSVRNSPDTSVRYEAVTPDTSVPQNTKSINTNNEHKEGGTADAAIAPDILSSVESELMEKWNALKGLPRIRTLNGKRRKTLCKRLAEKNWDWREALDLIPQCPFLLGSKGWTATIDWFLKPDSVTRIVEGNYCDRNGGNGVDQHSGLMEFARKGEE